MSESVLGVNPQAGSTRQQVDPRWVYSFSFAVPMNDTVCGGAMMWNYTDPRGFAWANGEIRSGLYNHRFGPNAAEIDCVSARTGGPLTERYAAYGWRAARSLHAGGVNALLADGSARKIADDVASNVWQALATRAGGEQVE
jgi:prepilin-type processing-associated H-X9-DG protein